ncbi:MAG: hypothetical protein QOH38_1544, partial [Thermoleophilaceae bacterium]|nr:hypothetical protein [Thermoleophilaceae bacterium]
VGRAEASVQVRGAIPGASELLEARPRLGVGGLGAGQPGLQVGDEVVGGAELGGRVVARGKSFLHRCAAAVGVRARGLGGGHEVGSLHPAPRAVAQHERRTRVRDRTQVGARGTVRC